MIQAERPTTRDENWRYADGAVLASLDPDVLEQWEAFDVAPGETARRTIVAGGAGPELVRVRVSVGDGATAELFGVVAGDAYARLEVVVSLGQGAHFQFGGVTIGGGEAVREIVTRMDHAQPDGTSDQVIRAVHWGTATGNFLGRIDVARHAQKTDAAQDFKGLILERGAATNARPELEIYADDVKCAHGASIGQLDENARFYMAARGLPPELARKLLVQAFIGDAFAALADEDEQARLMDVALAALGDRS